MTESQQSQNKPGNKPSNKPFLYGLILVPIMGGVGYWAGSEIADGEFTSQKLDELSAQSKVVIAKHDVAPHTVLSAADLVEKDEFANRKVGGEVTSSAEVIGKKTQFGLNEGQVVVLRDIEQ